MLKTVRGCQLQHVAFGLCPRVIIIYIEYYYYLWLRIHAVPTCVTAACQRGNFNPFVPTCLLLGDYYQYDILEYVRKTWLKVNN